MSRDSLSDLFDALAESIARPVKRAPYEFTTYHRVEALMGMELFPKTRTTQEVLKDQGVVCSDNGAPEKPGVPVSVQRQRGRIIAFGRWRAAA